MLPAPATSVSNEHDWAASLAALKNAAEKPVFVVYAPIVPRISGGVAEYSDPFADEFSRMTLAARDAGLRVLDMRPALRVSAENGQWPHGFHNGQIGNGHLNADGYRVIADELIAAIESGE